MKLTLTSEDLLVPEKLGFLNEISMKNTVFTLTDGTPIAINQ
jgi:hypothetical protein